MGRPFFVACDSLSKNCSGNSKCAVHVSMARNGAIDAVLASFESDRSFVNIATTSYDQFEVADHLVIFQHDQDVLHAVVVSQKDFDLASSGGVFLGIPADGWNGFDN